MTLPTVLCEFWVEALFLCLLMNDYGVLFGVDRGNWDSFALDSIYRRRWMHGSDGVEYHGP